jgi:hypothetical protein
MNWKTRLALKALVLTLSLALAYLALVQAVLWLANQTS